jgi:hypothetical protein
MTTYDIDPDATALSAEWAPHASAEPAHRSVRRHAVLATSLALWIGAGVALALTFFDVTSAGPTVITPGVSNSPNHAVVVTETGHTPAALIPAPKGTGVADIPSHDVPPIAGDPPAPAPPSPNPDPNLQGSPDFTMPKPPQPNPAPQPPVIAPDLPLAPAPLPPNPDPAPPNQPKFDLSANSGS